MPYPEAFDAALKQFENSGCFTLKDASLTVSQLSCIKRLVEKRKSTVVKHTLHYEFCLHNVVLISDNIPEQVLQGSVTEHTVCIKPQVAEHIFIVQAATNHFENVKLKPTTQERRVAQRQAGGRFENRCNDMMELQLFDAQEKQVARQQTALLALFSGDLDLWSRLELIKIRFSHQEKDSNLSYNFYSRLNNLAASSTALENLSLSLPVLVDQSLQKQGLLALSFFGNKNLKTLALEIENPDCLNWHAIGKVLIDHPRLEKLDLSHTASLSTEAYNVLLNLLNENYRINSIDLPPLPVKASQKQRQLHSSLMQEQRDRPQCGTDRFRSKQLTQNQLISLVSSALKEKKIDLFLLIVSGSTNRSHTSLLDENGRLSPLYHCLPQVYHRHADYFADNFTHFQLNLKQLAAENSSKTVGYVLLEQALSEKNQEAIEGLVELDDMIEILVASSSEENQLLNKLLFKCSDLPWQKQLIDRLHETLPTLPSASIPSLLSFTALYSKLEKLKELLCDSLDKLVERSSHRSLLLQMFTSIGSPDLSGKQEEWIKIFTMYRKIGADLANNKTEASAAINSQDIQQVQQSINSLRELAQHAKRNHNLRGCDEFNDKLIGLCNEFDRAIAEYEANLLIEAAIAQSAQQLMEDLNNKEQQIKEKIEAQMEEKLRQREDKVKGEISQLWQEISNLRQQCEELRGLQKTDTTVLLSRSALFQPTLQDQKLNTKQVAGHQRSSSFS